MDKNMLLSMLKDIEERKQDDKATTYKKFVEKRISKALETYYHELSVSYDSLMTHHEVRVLNKINYSR